MSLPEKFISSMKAYYTSHPALSWEDFYKSFSEIPRKGVRLNSLKVKKEDVPFFLSLQEKVPWSENGFYAEDSAWGVSSYYHAGAFYIQEPSAMLPAEILAPKPGDRVLDLCAAPGGKATRLGEFLQNEGLLVANEISSERAKALLRNIELFGIENVVITNETPEKLSAAFSSFFDKILIDAPCSGEGMFRRDPQAIKSWEKYGPDFCRELQENILEQADRMLRVGGEMVYSTCTFNTVENEEQMDSFLERHPGYEVIKHPNIEGVLEANGRLFDGGMRIWPQNKGGDGHFCVHLRKIEEHNTKNHSYYPKKRKRNNNDRTYSARTAKEAFFLFCEEMMQKEAFEQYKNTVQDRFYLFGDKIHLFPILPESFDGLKVVKMGGFPGTVKRKGEQVIFIPSHSFAMTFSREQVKEKRYLSLQGDDERVGRYLFGETIFLKDEEKESLIEKGYFLLMIDGLPLGWGQRNGGSVKNEYPPAWRRRK